MTAKPAARKLYLHVGIHKTGTTSIQAFITANDASLASAGIFVPRTGRLVHRWGTPNTGHHNIAWHLNDLPNYQPDEGSFEQLLDEISGKSAPIVVLSSEDFEWLHVKPEVLRRVAEDFSALGYSTEIVIYLRAQSEYMQAVYSEGAKAGYLYGMDYDRNIREIFETGAYTPDPRVVVRIEYGRILDAFAAAFGQEHVVVKPYQAGLGPDVILSEFLSIVGGGLALPFASLVKPPPLNVSPSLFHVLAGMHRGIVKERDSEAPDPQTLVAGFFTRDEAEVVNRKFDVMTENEIARILERFARDNREVERRYGARVPFITQDDLPRRDRAHWDAVERQRALLFHALRAWKIV